MPATVFAAVLLGAALHATWNAIVKGGSDKLMTTVLVVAASGLVAAALLPFLPLPAPASRPFLAASAAVQLLYLALVAGAYAATDMSRAYPLMRGLAPALVALAGVAFLGEHLSALAWAGIAFISTGVFTVTFAASGEPSRKGTILALLNAAVIASYTLIDGIGVRRSGAPVAYATWLFLLNAVPLVGWALLARRRAFLAYAATDMSRAYPLMRGLAPALVAVAGVAFLGERLGPLAWAGVALISSGVFATTFVASGEPSRKGTLLALANAAVIASYTLIDGVGVRRSGAPVAYATWLFLLNALPLVAWALLARRQAFLACAARTWRLGLVGGLGNLGSYGLALWAMAHAPVAAVAALRETSILFGIAIAAVFLGERITPARVAAAALIVAGAASLRLV